MSIRIDGVFYVLDAISDNILAGLLAECRDRFFICSRHKNRSAEVEQVQDRYSMYIQICKEEIERREHRKMRAAA